MTPSPAYRRALKAFQECSMLRDEEWAARNRADLIRDRLLPDAVRAALNLAAAVPASDDEIGQIKALATHYGLNYLPHGEYVLPPSQENA
jgi:hypothetical protein